MGVFLRSMVVFVGLCALPACADVSATLDGSVYCLANEAMRIEIDAAAGARVRSWRLLPSGREMIALWEGPGEIGGALDDRAVFTSLRYDGAIMHPGPDVAVLRFEANHPSGLSVVKIITLRKGESVLGVRYEWRNGTQAPQRLFIRNFLLPGTQPQTEGHLYWVHGAEPAVAASPTAGGYVKPSEPAYAALWDNTTGDGLVAYAPGVSQFYFWRESKVFPTFEWLYESVPAGKVLTAEVRITGVSEGTEPPDWDKLVAAGSQGVQAARLTDLPGWQDEATLFGVTDEERARGFWLSVGQRHGKSRLPQPLEIDLPLNAARYVAVSINALATKAVPMRVDVPEAWREEVTVSLETLGDDRKELLPLPEGPVRMEDGAACNVWLRVDSTGREAGEYDVPLRLTVGEAAVGLALRLRVWPVAESTKRPFHVRGYSGGFPVWTGGYEVTPEKLKVLDAILAAYSDMGGDVVEWEAVWARLLQHVRVEGTEQTITQFSQDRPEQIDLQHLPDLDFSYYDPWFDLAKRHGVGRVDGYMMHPTDPKLSWYLLTPAVGAAKAEPGTPEAEKVMVWLYSQMKRYLESKGLEGFQCKISDEISPEHIPAHIETAKLVQRAGWRPFTTITGMIARTARYINELNPYCDQWQLAFGLKDDFLALCREKMKLVEESYELKGPWGHYTNGGAVETWGMKVFGEGGPVALSPDQVEGFALLEDGKELATEGGSPWGNTHRGVVITGGSLGQYLYVSPADGSSPDKHRYELRLTVRRPAPDGEPLVKLDPGDEVWCYGGGSSPFRAGYGTGYTYPLMTLHHGFGGYGQWAFYHWNKTERVIWVDEETARVTVSPVYCGYRDGWHDCLLLCQLSPDKLADILGSGEGCPLRVSGSSQEVYSFTTLQTADDPVAINEGRRRALAALGGR